MLRPARFVCLTVILALGPVVGGKTIYVSVTGNNLNDGLSPSSAKRTIQAGVDAAAPRDTVLVGPGTYSEAVVVTDKPLWLRSTHGAHATTIDASSSVGSVLSFVNNSYLGTNPNISDGAVVEGFRITGGSNVPAGGGVRVRHSIVTVRACIVAGNTAEYGGGASFDWFSTGLLVLENCLITGNTAMFGAAVGVFGDGSYYTPGPRILINHCTIAGNTASFGAAVEAVSYYSGSPIELNLANTVVWGNNPVSFKMWSTEGKVIVSAERTTIEPHPESNPPPGAWSVDPMLTDIPGGVYTPAAGSPMIDAAAAPTLFPNEITQHLGEYDMSGAPRLSDNHFDIGAFEFQGVPVCSRLLRQPAGVGVGEHDRAFLSADVFGVTGADVRWHRNGTPIYDLPGVIDGAATTTLQFLQARVTDAGDYTLRVSKPCGTSETAPAALAVTPECAPFPGWAILTEGHSGFEAPGDPHLRMTNTLTVEAWVRPLDRPGPFHRMILNKEGEYEIARLPSGNLGFALANASPGWTWVDTGIPLPLDQWNHVALTYNGSVARAYLNGVPRFTFNAYGPVGDVWPTLNALRIGTRSTTQTEWFYGAIDDVRVWGRVLSDAEIAANFNQESPANISGLIGRWRFNENSGTVTANLGSAGPAQDAAMFGAVFWRPTHQCCPQDINRDGVINIADLIKLLSGFDGTPFVPALRAT